MGVRSEWCSGANVQVGIKITCLLFQAIMNETNTQAFELPASRYARFFQEMLEPAGIRLNGSNAWDITVHDDRLLSLSLIHI